MCSIGRKKRARIRPGIAHRNTRPSEPPPARASRGLSPDGCGPIMRALRNTGDAIPMDALERIKKQVSENPVILYMKGTPDFPQCGFSARAVEALKACG